VAVAISSTCAGSPAHRAQSVSTVDQLDASIIQGGHLSAPPVASDSSGTPTDSSLDGGPGERTFVEREAPETGSPLFWVGSESNQQLPLVTWRRSGPLDLIGVEWEPVDRGPLDTGDVEWELMDRGPLDTGDVEWELMDRGPLDIGGVEWEPMDRGPLDTDGVEWEPMDRGRLGDPAVVDRGPLTDDMAWGTCDHGQR
jgi:hypothetical protein